MITVHKFQKYNITIDKYEISRRMATLEAIQKLGPGFVVIENTAIEIDEAKLDPDMPGMTKIKNGWLEFIGERQAG